jgi:hypothetical protein
VTFPDFPGLVSAGDTAEEALVNAHEALARPCRPYGAGRRQAAGAHGRRGCRCRSRHSDGGGHTGWLTVPGKAKRVNVTLDEALLEEIDEVADNRSRFLAEAARAELARRSAN